MAKALYEVTSTFTVGKEGWNNAPIAVVAESAEDARDKAPGVITELWKGAKVIKIGDARLLLDMTKKEEAN